YRDCPRQHWFRYVRRLEPEASPEGHLGDAVHRTLMAAGRLRLQGLPVTAEMLRAQLAEAWSLKPFPDRNVEPTYRRLAETMVLRYSESHGFEARLTDVERAFETPLDGLRLKGVIDRIDAPAAEGGPHVLIDYKTGAPLPASRLRRDLQLALYALGARRELGLDPLELEIVYLRGGERVRIPADDALLREAEQLTQS